MQADLQPERSVEMQQEVSTSPRATTERPSPTYVFALGRIDDPRFPSLGVEKEFRQTQARTEAAGLTGRRLFQQVLSERPNRYLARQMCWVLTIEGQDTYILTPRDPLDFELLSDALRPVPGGDDVDVVVGRLGPIAPPEACNGLMIPIVVFDQIYSFDLDALVQAVPRPETISEKEEPQFRENARDLFRRIQQLADNAGATDEHRALNYLATRYDRIYHRTAEADAAGSSLSGVEVRRSRLSVTRKIVDVIFAYTDRQTDVTEKDFVRVDVTDEFPFLVNQLSPYYDR